MTKTTSAPPAELSATADPELAVTLEWCAAMRAARKSRGLSQTDLARAIRPATSQATISTIEKGVDESGRPVASDRILPICRVLEIAPPVVGQSPMMMRWIAVWRAPSSTAVPRSWPRSSTRSSGWSRRWLRQRPVRPHRRAARVTDRPTR